MVAKTILEQLGSGKFIAMTGSKDFIDLGNGLRMNLARNKTSANRLEIILDRETDTYTMKFFRQTFSKKTFEVSKRILRCWKVSIAICWKKCSLRLQDCTQGYDRTGGENRPALLLTVSRRLKSSKKPSLNPLNFQRVVFLCCYFNGKSLS